jgi:hypothetical protein
LQFAVCSLQFAVDVVEKREQPTIRPIVGCRVFLPRYDQVVGGGVAGAPPAGGGDAGGGVPAAGGFAPGVLMSMSVLSPPPRPNTNHATSASRTSTTMAQTQLELPESLPGVLEI